MVLQSFFINKRKLCYKMCLYLSFASLITTTAFGQYYPPNNNPNNGYNNPNNGYNNPNNGYNPNGPLGLNPGYFTFGLNTGLSYQSSDVTSRFNSYGFGLTLAQNLIYLPGSWLTFDWRARGMYSASEGLNTKPSFGIKGNTAINGTTNDGLSYANDSFYFANYHTDMVELGLEGVITLNDLRERTGVVLQVFGGIGMDWYDVRIDQKDAAGNNYSKLYKSINLGDNTTTIKDKLVAGLDGTHESRADGFGKIGKIGFMPNVGIEFGYMLTPRFYLSMGHKITFSHTDLLDGQQWLSNTIKLNHEDLHQYTYIGLHFLFESNPFGFGFGQRSFVQIIAPETNPYTSYSPTGVLRAIVNNIRNPRDIILTVNNLPTNFNLNGSALSSDFNLTPGINQVVIRTGNDARTVTIFYKPDGQNVGGYPYPSNPNYPNTYSTSSLDSNAKASLPNSHPNKFGLPQLRFSSPVDNSSFNDPNIGVRMSLQNVTEPRTVQLKLNGALVNIFPTNGSASEASASVTLKEGRNSLELTASNALGTSTAVSIANYYPLSKNYPIVKIISPINGAIYASQKNVTLRARVTNVNDKAAVTVSVGGTSQSNCSFNAGDLSCIFNLNPGTNIIKVNASNNLGNAQDFITIIYRPEQPKTFIK